MPAIGNVGGCIAPSLGSLEPCNQHSDPHASTTFPKANSCRNETMLLGHNVSLIGGIETIEAVLRMIQGLHKVR